MQGENGKTLLYLQTQKSVRAFSDKMQGLLFKWHSLSYGGKLLIEIPNGGKICYEGIGYKGSPRQVYWGRWSEAFFEEAIPEILATTGQMAVDAQIDVDMAIGEAAEQLRDLANAFYNDFSRMDQALMGNGIQCGPRRDPTHKVLSVIEFVNQVSEINRRKYGFLLAEKKTEERKDIVDIKLKIGVFEINFRELYRRIRSRIKREMVN